MRERTLENLVLENKDHPYIYEGILIITGNLYISNCELAVLGQLILEETAKVQIINGNIRAETLKIRCRFLDSLGNIFVKNLYAYSDIDIKGNIEVSENSSARNILCYNYSVGCDNNSLHINAEKKIHIKGKNNSLNISGYYVFIEKDCSCWQLTANTFMCKGNFKATSINISKFFECKKEVMIEKGGLSFLVN